MDIERFREECLSWEGVMEKTPFGKFASKFESMLVFYVCGHMFCIVDIDDFNYAVVKNVPEKVSWLHDTRRSCGHLRNMSAKYWIQLDFGGDISDVEIMDLVRESYLIVKSQYTKGKKAR